MRGRRVFTGVEETRFAPHAQAVEPLLRFAGLAGFAGVKIDAVLAQPLICETRSSTNARSRGSMFVDSDRRASWPTGP